MPARKISAVSDSVSSGVARALKNASSRRLSGFTLVELIVVITILAILATIGFLALSGYSSDARDSSLKANVRSVVSAISSESALTGNSPRYYVVHDTGASLTGAFAYIDGAATALTGGTWDAAGTNYSAGNPDYAKLKLNQDKFKVAVTGFGKILSEAFAAYDATGQLSVGAIDYSSTVTATGRKRSSSYFQVAGINPTTKSVTVNGNYPGTSLSNSVAGLVKASGYSVPLVDGYPVGSIPPTTYPGCDTPDVVLANGQTWAACNVGASNAWTGGMTFNNTGATNQFSDYNSAIRSTLGNYYQWGKNENVTSVGSGAQVSTGSSSTVLGYFAKGALNNYDWLTDAAKNDNLWGGGSTSRGAGYFTGQTTGNQALMTGPCAAGYHVPTQAEWWSAISTLNGTLSNTAVWQDDTTLVSTLKLPLSGYRHYSTALHSEQGTLGIYWTSSTNGTNGYDVTLSTTQVYPASANYRAFGLSVRCLKN